MNILLATADREQMTLLSYWLTMRGHAVVSACDGEQVINYWRKQQPDLLVLDLHLPVLDGFEVCRAIRAESEALILMLVEAGREEDEIRGFNLGADAVAFKPLGPRLLMARIHALLRRSQSTARASTVTAGPLTLNLLRQEVIYGDQTIALTPVERRMLQLLITSVGQVLPIWRIVEYVWGPNKLANVRFVKTHIHHLRQKIEEEPASPRYIVTVPGVGYMFVLPKFDDATLVSS